MLRFFILLIVCVNFFSFSNSAAVFKDVPIKDFIFIDPNYRLCGIEHYPLDNGVPFIYNMGYVNGEMEHKLRFTENVPILKSGNLRNFKIQNYLSFENRHSIIRFDSGLQPTVQGKRIFVNIAFSLNDLHPQHENKINIHFEGWSHTLEIPPLHPLDSNILVSIFDKYVIYHHPYYVENRVIIKQETLETPLTDLINGKKFIDLEVENINLYHFSISTVDNSQAEYSSLMKTWDLIGSGWSGFRLHYQDEIE